MNWIDQRRQRERRRRAGKVLTALAGAVGALLLVGVLLPAEHSTTSRTVLGRSRETVWRVLTDLDAMPLWRSDVSTVERLPDLLGKPTWREVGRGGARMVELSLAEPPRRMVIQRASNGTPSLPMRTFELESTAAGTELTVTERATSRNPFRRVLVRLHLPRPAIERLLRDLTERLAVNHPQVASRDH